MRLPRSVRRLLDAARVEPDLYAGRALDREEQDWTEIEPDWSKFESDDAQRDIAECRRRGERSPLLDKRLD